MVDVDTAEHPAPVAPVDVLTREDELERFRVAWRAEVLQKKSTLASTVLPPISQLSGNADQLHDQVYWGPSTSSAQLDLALQRLTTKPQPAARASHEGASTLPSTRWAIDLYHEALECEQQGNLDEALVLYRRSFKLDSNVDKAYHRLVARQSLQSRSISQQQSTSKQTQDNLSSAKRPILNSSPHTSRSISSLPHIISSFEPRPIIFAPEDEHLPCPLRRLPDELILHILMLLACDRDITTVERFATISLKGRLLAADSSIWRFICEYTYIPPQIKEDLSATKIASLYGYNYRHTFIHHPRVRVDGCYIAVCHYIRPGQSENAWVAIRHLITYHRLLRFYPDGTVVSLLTNEEKPLADIVHLLKPEIRVKGSQLGTWSLEDSQSRLRIRHLRAADPGGRGALKYEFAMDLTITSSRNMRQVESEMQWYASVNVATGEVQELPIKRERPFYFSKVRSYVV
ncbi:hypothetical protein DACRYDRAFT_49450 [Dacryopinax primogenitus]|uniref:F-box protein Hrt3/FBXO9 C-terminal domain-containing protein n=1 Tax=Dacryopinax primogenitus (strain DJM 731) TaxID=1858805 RepID=M5GCC7_DACPD|nr:uncharacterized protein DACRYDRAFT_49450 [Dacryopinax primogenitus]EJU03807.1 hypothetical protein DACRYDRAFT_49450 [Dacryopinax primogenitus]